MFAGSGNGVYTVSKYATCGLMEELRIELHETNIGTSVLFPGFTATQHRAGRALSAGALSQRRLPRQRAFGQPRQRPARCGR